MGKLGTVELVLLAVIILLVFGTKRIPEFIRGLGKAIKEIKDALK